MVTDNKSFVSQLDWSVDGAQLLALDENGVVHAWRRKVDALASTWVFECVDGWSARKPSFLFKEYKLRVVNVNLHVHQ